MPLLGKDDLQGCGKTFLFYDFFSKVVNIGNQGILTIFGHILAILEDFLTEKEKMHKTIKLHHIDT